MQTQQQQPNAAPQQQQNTFTFGNQPQTITDIDIELHQKLVKAGIIKASPKGKINEQGKKITIDNETSLIIESGVALAKYLSASKTALSKKGLQDLTIDLGRLSTLKPLPGPQTKLFNWNIIIHELDNMGVKIDSNSKSLIVAGDKDTIVKLFKQVEAFITKIANGQSIDLEDQTLESATANTQRGSVARKRKARDGVDILTMQTDRKPSETESSLELILNTLCRAFSMKPKQAAALFTNNNQFLIHSIVKGVKGNYEPLNNWYNELKAHLKHMNTLLEIETEQLPQLGNIPKVLGTLAAGLYSQNIDICRQSFETLNLINQELSTNKDMFGQAHDWVVEKDGGLELSLQAFKRHPELAGDFIHFVAIFSKLQNQSVDQIYREELRTLFQGTDEYISIINDIFPYLVIHQSKELRSSGILDYWMDMALEQGGLDQQHSSDEKISALTLLTDIWLTFTDIVDQKPDRVNFIQQVLKKAGRDRLRSLRIVAVSLMFRLLDKFAGEKNPSAPAIYKALIFSLIENPGDIQIREHYFSNFTYLFETQTSIPLSLLVDPLLKQISLSENVTYFYKVFDFDFFTVLAKHPKLSSSNAVSLADLLAKVYLNEPTIASAASVPLMLLCSRFNQNDEQMQEFIVKFETICLASLMNLEKDAEEKQKNHQKLLQEIEAAKKGKTLALPAPDFQHKHGKPTKRMTKEEIQKEMKEKEQEAIRRVKKSQAIQILLRLQNLKQEDLNDQLKELLLSTNRRFNKMLYGYYNPGIMVLLRYWGDPETLMAEYMEEADIKDEHDKKEKEQRERLAKQERERLQKEERTQQALRKQQDEMMKLRALLDAGHVISEDEERRLMLWEENGGELLLHEDADPAVRDSMALMLYQGGTMNKLNAATMRNQKAINHIDKIQRTKIEMEEQKRLEEERKKLLSVRRNKKLKEVIDKRKLEHGVGVVAESEDKAVPDQLILREDDPEQEKAKKLMSKMMLPEIKLLNLDEEENRDKESMLVLMKNYAKLWKNLYYKYSNSGFSSKKVTNFDQMNERSQTISLAEVTKLLKEHNAYPNLINKEELQTLFKLVNAKLFNNKDIQELDYPAYYQLMMQLAYFCFTREPRDLSHLPLAETIKALIKHFEDATRSRGYSTVLYEDPDATSVADAKLIKALNDKLARDPNYPIPEGYSKQLEKTPIYDYVIPAQFKAKIKESKVIALEILDSVLSEKLGIHFLEPMVKFEEHYKVKQQIKMASAHLQQSTQAEALSYMNKVEKKLKPVENTLNPYASLSSLDKLKFNAEVKPELNITLKLEVAKAPIKSRPFIQDVAEVFEEILVATEKGLKTLPPRLNRTPGQVWNDAKQKREDEQRKEKDLRVGKEDVRKKRDALVKNELVKLKEIKEKDEAEKKIRDAEEEKKRAEQKKKADEAIKKKLEALAGVGGYEAKKKQLEEEKKKKQEEEEKKRLEAEKKAVPPEKAKTERKDFMKQQKLMLKETFQQLIKQREDVATKQELVALKEKELQSKVRQSMDVYLKESTNDRGKEQKERTQLQEFIEQEDVQGVFDRFDASLRHMFKFYSSQDKKDVGFNLERAMNTMNMRELIRFSYQQLIIPTLLQPEDIVQIYRQLIRERQDNVTQTLILTKSDDNYLGDKNFAQIIDYDMFKKALVRIATLSATEQHAGTTGINDKLEKETALKKKTKKNTNRMSIDEAARAKEEAFMDKMQDGNAGAGKQPSSNAIKTPSTRSRSTVKTNNLAPSATADQAQPADGSNSRQQTLNPLTISLRKSKEVKLLRDLQEKEQLNEKIMSQATKIDKDRRVRKDFNVSLIQAKTIEALLRFLELEPDEKSKSLDLKLNQHRIEIQGQKPNRIKKQLKNNKLEDYIQERDNEDDEEFRRDSSLVKGTTQKRQLQNSPGANDSVMEDGEVLQNQETEQNAD